MAHIMFVRALTVLLFLTTAANAESMKELALIALLGGGDLDCGDAFISKGLIGFEHSFCEMTTDRIGVCRGYENDQFPAGVTAQGPYDVIVEFIELDNGWLGIEINGIPAGTCG